MKYAASSMMMMMSTALVRQFGNCFNIAQYHHLQQQQRTVVMFSLPFSTTTFDQAKYNSPIQKIYDQLESIPDMCVSVKNPLFCPNIKSVLDTMKTVTLNDLGITESKVSTMNRNTCSTIIEVADRFEIAVFYLSKGRSLPIHNHPHMTVLSRVVYGELKLRSFTSDDTITTTISRGFASEPPNRRESKESLRLQPVTARLCEESMKCSQDESWFLGLKDGNYHEFTALSNCVVFDVLLPPYDESHDRVCTYYTVDPPPYSVDNTKVTLRPCTGDPFTNRDDVPLLVPYTGTMPRRRSILPRFKATY